MSDSALFVAAGHGELGEMPMYGVFACWKHARVTRQHNSLLFDKWLESASNLNTEESSCSVVFCARGHHNNGQQDTGAEVLKTRQHDTTAQCSDSPTQVCTTLTFWLTGILPRSFPSKVTHT
jgi:hypothetical protein